MDFRNQIRDVLGTRIELRLGDPSDSEVDRRVAANVPKGRPGRGLTDDRAPLPRRPAPGRRPRHRRRPRRGRRGPRPPGQRRLDRPARAQAAAAALQVDPRAGPRLAGPDDRASCSASTRATSRRSALDLAESPHFYLFGDSDSGKSGLPALLRARGRRGSRARRGEAVRRRLPPGAARRAAREPPAASTSPPRTRRRGRRGHRRVPAHRGCPGPDVTPEQLRCALVVAAGRGLLPRRRLRPGRHLGRQPAAPARRRCSPQAGDVGLHLALTRRSGGASRAMFEPVLQSVRDLGSPGILLSGNPDEGALIGRTKPTPQPPGRRARRVARAGRAGAAAGVAAAPPGLRGGPRRTPGARGWPRVSTMNDPVYRPVIYAAKTLFFVQGTKFTITGEEHVPEARGRRHGDQPHVLPRLHVCRAAGVAAPALRAVHGEEVDLRAPGRRPADARDAAHPGRPRTRAARRSRPRSGRCGPARSSACSPRRRCRRSFELKEFKPGRREDGAGRGRPRAADDDLGRPAGVDQEPAQAPAPGRRASRSASPSASRSRSARRDDVAAATERLKAAMQAQLDAQQAAYPRCTATTSLPAGPARRHGPDTGGGARRRPARHDPHPGQVLRLTARALRRVRRGGRGGPAPAAAAPVAARPSRPACRGRAPGRG